MACRWGMSWIVIFIVVFLPGTVFITYIVAWQLGHINPILPHISLTAMKQPASCVFAELLNISAICVGIAMYVRYRQVADCLSSSESPHPARINKVSLGIGVAVVFGMSLVANFPFSDISAAVTAIHVIGATLSFGVGVAYAWMHVALSFITRPRLSSLLVCWIRVTFAVVHTIMFLLTTIFDATRSRHSLDWRRASAACQWTMMTSIILYFLTFIGEFRYVAVKPDVKVTYHEVPTTAPV